MAHSKFLSYVVLPLALVASSALAHADSVSFAEERAKIEDLHARYLFAYDWHDVESYLATFTEDGLLDYGGGELKGHDAIRAYLTERRERREKERAATPEGERTPVGRHVISNVVVQIDGDRARSVAYWTHMRATKTGYGTVEFFGHYEDDLVKKDGKWLYERRRVYNQAIPEWSAHDNNPAVSSSPPMKKREVSTGTTSTR